MGPFKLSVEIQVLIPRGLARDTVDDNFYPISCCLIRQYFISEEDTK